MIIDTKFISYNKIEAGDLVYVDKNGLIAPLRTKRIYNKCRKCGKFCGWTNLNSGDQSQYDSDCCGVSQGRPEIKFAIGRYLGNNQFWIN